MSAAEVLAWLSAFLFGQVIEVPLYVAALRRAAPATPPRGPLALLAIAFGATALTHPVVWWLFPLLCRDLPYWLMAVLAESFAVLAEARYLHAFGLRGPRRALLIALLGNGASCGLGLLSRHLFGWP